ncbi:MAG: GNAT family N-acetyltransferase [Acidimicrobiales bacterium]
MAPLQVVRPTGGWFGRQWTLRSNVWHDTPVALLDELYVVPAEREQGIGSALLEDCCFLVRSRGVELMEINVNGEDVTLVASTRLTASVACTASRHNPSCTTAVSWPDPKTVRWTGVRQAWTTIGV